MEVDKKHLIMRNPDYFSELEFAKILKNKGIEPFFPFRDEGIDIIGKDNKNRLYFYQLKARNFSKNKCWGFKIDTKKFKKFPDTKRSYWVFCALRMDEPKFDFFEIPYKKLKEIYSVRMVNAPKTRGYFIDIKKKDGKWKFVTDRLNKIANLNDFLIK